MKRVDYINGEAVMCFPTPILDLNILRNNQIKLSTGDFVNFERKSIVPTSTYYYKYKENLLILDFKRSNPIVHIIRHSKVRKTIELKKLTLEDLYFIEQMIDVEGNILKVYSLKDIFNFYNEFKDKEIEMKNIYTKTQEKFKELMGSSNKLKELDKVYGTNKVINFINEDNFKIIKSELAYLHNIREENIDSYKNTLINDSRFTTIIALSKILEKELLNDFKLKTKVHKEYLDISISKSSILNKTFNNKWYIEDLYNEEKKLGALFDCLNEVICDEKFSKEDEYMIETIIAENLNNNDELLDLFLEWVDLCPIDKEEMREVLIDIIKDVESRKTITID